MKEITICNMCLPLYTTNMLEESVIKSSSYVGVCTCEYHRNLQAKSAEIESKLISAKFALRRERDLRHRAQSILSCWIQPLNGYSNERALSLLLEVFDGPEQRETAIATDKVVDE